MGCPRPNTVKSDSHDLGELRRDLRDRVYTAMHYSPRWVRSHVYGLVLVSGYRDPGSQWDIRHDRVPAGQECNPAYRANPATAVPYASKHQTREAADMGGYDLRWLADNCRRFGLYRAVPSELWHFQVAGTPSVSLITYPGHTYDGQGAPISPVAPKVVRNWRSFGPGATDKGIYLAGGLPTEVTEHQLLLTSIANLYGWKCSPGRVDGQFGRMTVAATQALKLHTINFQNQHGMKPWPNADAIVGPVTIGGERWLAANPPK